MKTNIQTLFKIQVSELPRVIPPGSVIEIERVPTHALRYGDVVYVTRPDRAVLCRFLRLWRSNDETIMMLALAGIHEALAVPSGNLLGRVKKVLDGTRVIEPNKEWLFSRILPRLTDYGTADWIKRLTS